MMKSIYTILLLIFIGLIACQKEIITTEKEVVVDPPIDLEYAFYSGTILSEGVSIANTEITVYQLGKEIGKVVSNSEGQYSTHGLDLVIGKDVTFEIKTEHFITKINRKGSELGIYENSDFRIYKKGGQFTDSKTLATPEDTTNVIVFGTFTDDNNNPIKDAKCWVLWDIIQIDDSHWNVSGAFERTDENGYFEMLAPTNKRIVFLSKDSLGGCNTFLNRDDETNLISFLPLQDLEELSEDIEIIELENLNLSGISNTIKGKFLHCDGTPIVNGELKVKTLVDEGNGEGYKSLRTYNIETFDTEGGFSIDTKLCRYTGDIKFEFHGKTDEYFSVDHEEEFQEGIMDIGELLTCTDNTPIVIIDTTSMNIILNIGNIIKLDDIIFNKWQSTPSNTIEQWTIASGLNIGNSICKIEIHLDDIKMGENDFLTFNVNPFVFDNTWNFNSGNGEIKAVVTTIKNDFFYGHLIGEVNTVGEGVQPITGTFKFHKY